ncbi:MAG: RNA polymerase sigma-70 factor [Paenibacillus sp.]|nr:RNA polymerase sigma-70 factor [Paenibacillus sp.]
MIKGTDDNFVKLYDTYFEKLMFHASRFVDDQAEAEDIVADVFYELWSRRDEIDFEKGIVSYMYKAVSMRALNVLRHKNVAAVRIEALEAINDRRMDFIDHSNLEEKIESSDIRTGIRDAMDKLPDKCKQAFILSYINGLKSKEIAQIMDISVRTVEAHVYKALRFLRERLHYLTAFMLIFLGFK